MLKKIIYLSIILLSFSSCVEQGHLEVNTIVQHISSSPDGLHPYNDNSSDRSFIFQYTQRTLIKLDMETLEYMPVLVEDLAEISEDQLKYTYKIRTGVKWDNGKQLTAEDVEFSTKLMLCPLTDNSQIRSNYNTVIKSIQTYPDDPLKFTMHAKEIHVSNMSIFSELYIQQKNLWDPNGILDPMSFEDIHSPNWKASKRIENWFIKFNQ